MGIRLEMKNHDTILTEKQYEYLTFKKILPSTRRQIIKQAKFTYSLLGEALE